MGRCRVGLFGMVMRLWEGSAYIHVCEGGSSAAQRRCLQI